MTPTDDRYYEALLEIASMDKRMEITRPRTLQMRLISPGMCFMGMSPRVWSRLII